MEKEVLIIKMVKARFNFIIGNQNKIFFRNTFILVYSDIGIYTNKCTCVYSCVHRDMYAFLFLLLRGHNQMTSQLC
jgi:hypothetical protein